MTRKDKTAAIGLLTIRHKPKKETPVFIPQPLPQPKPKPEPKPEPKLEPLPEPGSVPAKETPRVPEIPLTEDRTSAAETVTAFDGLPAEEQKLPQNTEPGNTPEPAPGTEIPPEPESAEGPETIPQTEPAPQTEPSPQTEPAPQTEPSAPGTKPPADKKTPGLTDPEFTIEPLAFTTRILSETELPESVTGMADITHAYAVLKKTNQEGLLESYPRASYFNLFLQEMYRRARKNGTVRYYEYAGKKALDFPLENDLGPERLFASFIPHEKEPDKWFFLGVRKGGKIHDLAYPGKAEETYRHMQNLTDLKAAGIKSRNELQTYLEDAFLKSAEEQTVFLYTIGEDTMVEYPSGLYRETDGESYIITAVYTFSTEKKWSFKRFRFRETEHELTESIRRDEAKLWRRAERKQRERERMQRRAEQAEAEYKAREREKNFILFDPFPVKRVQPETTADYFGDISRFAYINKELYLYLPDDGIRVMDGEEIRGYLQDAFKGCNPYADIDYYRTESEGDIAELKVTFPQNPEKEIYAVFTRNINQQKQPWYFKRFECENRFRRMFSLGDTKALFEQLCGIMAGEAEDLRGPETPEALESLMQKRFFSAIGCGRLFVYGAPPLKRAELPLYLRTADGSRILAYFTSGGSLYKWKSAGFKIRPGKGDERISISEEYKAECAAKQAEAERKQREREMERERVLEREREKEIADSARFEDELVKEHGTAVSGPDGKPVSLMEFCKEITEKDLYLLASMAEEERWGFTEEKPFEILYKYLNAQFIRLGYEQKLFVRYTGDRSPEYAVMHTGLYTRDLHEPIYAGFKPALCFSEDCTGPVWKLDGFCSEREGGPVLDRIHQRFPTLPETVDFLRKDGEYIPLPHYCLDRKVPIVLKEEHILKERGYRLPEQFLRDAFNYKKDTRAAAYLDRLVRLETEEEQKAFWLTGFSVYLEDAEETYDELLRRLQYVVEEAQACSTRQAVTTYYPRDNSITWLLPLRFPKEGELKNLALVVGRREAGGYKGITLMPIEAVYHRARVVANPDGSWVKREILDQYPADWRLMEEDEPGTDLDAGACRHSAAH